MLMDNLEKDLMMGYEREMRAREIKGDAAKVKAHLIVRHVDLEESTSTITFQGHIVWVIIFNLQ